MSGAVALSTATEAHRRGDLATAAACYRDLLRSEPRHAEASFWLGTILTQQGNVAEGLPLLEQALMLNPHLPDGQRHLGNVYRQLNRLEDATACFRKAVAAESENPEAHNNLGAVLISLAAYDEAERHLRRALELDAKFRPAMVNLGALMEVTGRYGDTLAWYDRALALQANDPGTRFQRAGALLIREELAEGWSEYRARFARAQHSPLYGVFPFPYWNGEPLSGRRILVWTEQGLGDEILASTMLGDLASLADGVTLICSPRVAPLLTRAYPNIRIIPAVGKIGADKLGRVDFQASVSELGRWLRPSLAAFPSPKAFLTPAGDRAATLRAKYRAVAGGKRLVGISWRSRSVEAEAEKSIPLAAWRQILLAPDIAFVNLQYGDVSTEVAAIERTLGVSILSDAAVDPVRDLEAFTAQVAAMDLVISVSNTTVHLAGALGQTVWGLIPSDRGRLWYWFLDRRDSPWYPRLRLFRKAIGGAWDSAIAEVADALAHFRPDCAEAAHIKQN